MLVVNLILIVVATVCAAALCGVGIAWSLGELRKLRRLREERLDLDRYLADVVAEDKRRLRGEAPRTVTLYDEQGRVLAMGPYRRPGERERPPKARPMPTPGGGTPVLK